MKIVFEFKTIHRLISLSTIISFLLISYSILLIGNSTTRGYEISIYSATPTIFWGAIIFGILNGFILIGSRYYYRSKLWVVGLFEILFCNCLVILLYTLRGYVLYFGRGDVASYVGMAIDVSKYGSFGSNIYPVISILISLLNQTTTVSIVTISKYLPSLFYVFYFLSVYCWSKHLIKDIRYVLSSMLVSLIILFAWFSTSIFHHCLSIWTLPFFFYLLCKNSDYRFKVFNYIFLLIYPLFHPITAVFIVFYLTLLYVFERRGSFYKHVSLSLLIFSYTSLTMWFIQNSTIVSSFNTMFLILFGRLNNASSVVKALYFVNVVGLIGALKGLILMIFDEVVVCFLSLLAIYPILLRKDSSNNPTLSKISICFITGNLFFIILFFFTKIHNPLRLLNQNINVLFTPPLVGYLLYKFINNNKLKKVFLVLILVFISSVTAIFTLYPSSITTSTNRQITMSDVHGMNWLLIEMNPNLKILNLESSILRFSDMLYGYRFRMNRTILIETMKISNHLRSDKNNLFPADKDKYLIVTEFWKRLDMLIKEDLIKISSCTNIDKIYENGELQNYLIHKND